MLDRLGNVMEREWPFGASARRTGVVGKDLGTSGVLRLEAEREAVVSSLLLP